jgi:hypothetical protein
VTTESKSSPELGGPRGGESILVLIAARGDDAHELSEALREARLSVITSSVVALPERCARLRPFAVVVDVEQAHALEAIRQIRDEQRARLSAVPPSSLDPQTLRDEPSARAGKTLILPIASLPRLEELGIALSPLERAFAPPVDAISVASFLRRIAGGEPSASTAISSKPGLTASSSVGALPGSAPSLPSGAGMLDSETLLADFPALADLPEIDAMLPEGDVAPARIGARRLSPEIEALLDESARRARELVGGPVDTNAEDVVVPPDLMAQLEDILLRDFRREATTDSEPPPAKRSAPAERRVESASVAPRDKTSGPPRAPSEPPKTFTGMSVPSPPSTDFGERSRNPEVTSAQREDQFPTVLPAEPFPSSEIAAQPTVPPASAARQSGDTELRGFSVGDVEAAKTIAPWEMNTPAVVRASPSFRRREPISDSEPPPTRAQLPSFPLSRAGVVPPPHSAQQPERGDPVEIVARVIRSRGTGSLRIASDDGSRVRHVLLREGDIVTAASELQQESLASLLVERGDVPADLLRDRAPRFPRSGRHAAAALIAQGFLSQDDLWPVLRAHAEWILGRTMRESSVVAELSEDPPDRGAERGSKLADEPNVFGGATGVEVFVDVVRRVVHPTEALARLGGADARLEEGELISLLHESALEDAEFAAVESGRGATLRAIIANAPDAAPLVFALVSLGVVRTVAPREKHSSAAVPAFDPLDADAIRKRVAARLKLVHEGNYFALLGVAPDATSYDIRRAYVALRRSLEPARLLTAATADLREDLVVIIDVLHEAYEVLRDDQRRSRYRRAIEATPD